MAAPARRADRVFVKMSYTTSLGAARAHVRYIAFRSREAPEQGVGVFDRANDHAQISRFTENLRDPLTDHPQVATVHKVVLSLSREQWDQAGYTSWRPIAREVMARFEERTGRRLEWVAAEHRTEGHPHCHISIKSVYTDGAGDRHRLRLDRRDIGILKSELQRTYERDRQIPRGVEQELRREQRSMDRSTWGRAAGDVLRVLAQAAKREQRRQEIEHQFERERERGD